MKKTSIEHSHKALLGVVLLFLIWSAINPHDYFTWFLEIFPAVLGFIAIAVTYNRFRLTNLAYGIIAIHAIILIIGGHYTYAEVPLFSWLRDIGLFARNNFDKIGHFYQGFGPAMIVREILLRKKVVKSKGWLNFIIVSIVLAMSAFYEFIEWWVSVATGSAGDSFLGTQGYVWDTQSDMFMCLIGAILALALLSRWHNRELAKVKQW